MTRKFFIITFRRWFRDPVNSLINLLGLASGLAATLLILVFVWNEMTMDRHHRQNDSIVRLVQGEWGLHAPALKNSLASFPAIEKSARIDMMYGRRSSVRYGDKLLSLNHLFFTDPEIFDILQFKFVAGNPNEALAKPFSMVLTTDQARIIFGDENPIGKTVRYSKSYTYTITAIVEPLKKTHLKFNALASFEDIPELSGQDDFLSREDQWNYHYYLKLAPDVDHSATKTALNKHLENLNWNHGKKPEFRFQPIEKVYFDTSVPYEFGIAHGSQELVISFALIGLFVLLLALINFVNISTAKLTDRAKEAGVKKTIGCSGTRLRMQILGESVMLSTLAMLLALMLVELILPSLRHMLDRPLPFNIFSPLSLIVILSLTGLTGFLAGIIPASLLSALKPVDVLKGFNESRSSKISLRSLLTTLQFVVSIALISTTIFTWQQFQFLSSKSLGIKLENIVFTSLSPEIRKSQEAFKTALEQHPGVQAVAFTNAVPGSVTWQESFEIAGETKQFTFLPITPEFLEMIDVNVLDGKLFSNAEAELESTIMLNQEAVSFFGWENPVGHRHYSEFWGKYQVTAVVQDFHYQDATKEVGPLVLMNSKRYSLIVCLQYDPNQIAPVLSHFENTWQKFSPEFPLEYHFLEDNFKNYYQDLRMQGRVFLYFSLLAIFIASLGLYGMVAHLAVKRRKAICIRKIHGASGQQLYYLLSSEILILITIAFITSVPLSYLFVSQWLEQFPYHINIQWHIFVFSGLLAILVALITISSHLIRLMRINPAEALRYE